MSLQLLLIREKKQELRRLIENTDLEKELKMLDWEEIEDFAEDFQEDGLPDLLQDVSAHLRRISGIKKGASPLDVPRVQYYPEIEGMDFLTEDEKGELDSFLAKLRPYCHHIHSQFYSISQQNGDKIKDYLLEKGVIKESYALLCLNCFESPVTGKMGKCEIESIKQKAREHDYDYLNQFVEPCMTCETDPAKELPHTKEDEWQFSVSYHLVKEANQA